MNYTTGVIVVLLYFGAVILMASRLLKKAEMTQTYLWWFVLFLLGLLVIVPSVCKKVGMSRLHVFWLLLPFGFGPFVWFMWCRAAKSTVSGHGFGHTQRRMPQVSLLRPELVADPNSFGWEAIQF